MNFSVNSGDNADYLFRKISQMKNGSVLNKTALFLIVIDDSLQPTNNAKEACCLTTK